MGAAVITVPQNTDFHFLSGSVSEAKGKSAKEESGCWGSERARWSVFENQGFPYVGLSHLFVTSIWMMKLERKTRKVQAA